MPPVCVVCITTEAFMCVEKPANCCVRWLQLDSCESVVKSFEVPLELNQCSARSVCRGEETQVLCSGRTLHTCT